MIDQTMIEKMNFILKKFYEVFDRKCIAIDSLSWKKDSVIIFYYYTDNINSKSSFSIPVIVIDLMDDSIYDLFWKSYKSKDSIKQYNEFIKDHEKQIKEYREKLRVYELAFEKAEKHKIFKDEIKDLKEHIDYLEKPISRWNAEIIQCNNNIKEWNDFITFIDNNTLQAWKRIQKEKEIK